MDPIKLIALTNAIGVVCPIEGVSIDAVGAAMPAFRPEATAEDRAAAQGVIDAFDFEAPAVPQSVTPYQARLALNAAGLREAAEGAIAAAPQDVRDAWEYALVIERSSPFIGEIGNALALSEQQIDALFISAGSF
jgi:hypothetical protein